MNREIKATLPSEDLRADGLEVDHVPITNLFPEKFITLKKNPLLKENLAVYLLKYVAENISG